MISGGAARREDDAAIKMLINLDVLDMRLGLKCRARAA